MARNSLKFDAKMTVGMPASISRAVDQVSARLMMSPSEYIRRSIIERMATDGVDVVKLSEPA